MRQITYIFCVAILFLGCKDTTDDGLPNNNGGAQDPPNGVQLVFPQEDMLCNEGENPTPTESTVFFEWEPNDNAETYLLTIENLDTDNIEQYETVDFIFPVTINRAQAFRWFVEYAYQNETKVSAVWNFYNAGPGVQTYAPFPAEIISPTMAQTIPATNSVTLEWNGSDVDDDIVGYDVYFGTTNPPELNTSDISTEQITVPVSTGNTYYWNIITKDAEGNSSESGVFEFRIL
ncbi:hypothetical protein [uncultured Psychroserpens sp.]|uniref:hypothetical protein n=1 Tax=uncultured Psychroserpens sp. TaxID=255436 RepID=UPI00262C6BFF|nr:hypothetical protein [uncultured Psychroserpens sp.]